MSHHRVTVKIDQSYGAMFRSKPVQFDIPGKANDIIQAHAALAEGVMLQPDNPYPQALIADVTVDSFKVIVCGGNYGDDCTLVVSRFSSEPANRGADERPDAYNLAADAAAEKYEAFKTAWPVGKPFRIEHDLFLGVVIGHYQRRDGKRGVVGQMMGTHIVHVYGEKWLKP